MLLFNSPKDAARAVPVKFNLKYRVNYGQNLRLIGSHPKFGGWDLQKALKLSWTDDDNWQADLELAPGAVYEYKYVVVDERGEAIEWQRGGNAVLSVSHDDPELKVLDNWGNDPGAKVLVNGEAITREKKLLRWATDMTAPRIELRQTKVELAAARADVKNLRQEVERLKDELLMTTEARTAERKARIAAQHEATRVRTELYESHRHIKSVMQETANLLNDAFEEVTALQNSRTNSSGGGGGAASSRNLPDSLLKAMAGTQQVEKAAEQAKPHSTAQQPAADAARPRDADNSLSKAAAESVVAKPAVDNSWRAAAEGQGLETPAAETAAKPISESVAKPAAREMDSRRDGQRGR